jgi:type I restriction enzyme S subunit
MDGLNMGIIKEMPLPVPPIETQAEFVSRARAAQDQHRIAGLSMTAMDRLFASLQHQAFAGLL